MLQIGKYTPAQNGRDALIQREFYGQGYIVKDEAAFLSHPDKVCYVPELSDTPYTHNDILALCDGQEALARLLSLNEHLLALLGGDSHRLFAQHVLACAEGGDGDGGVGMVGGADGHGINLSIREQLFHGGVGLAAVLLRHLLCPLVHEVVKTHDLCVLIGGVLGEVTSLGNAAAADNTDIQHSTFSLFK